MRDGVKIRASQSEASTTYSRVTSPRPNWNTQGGSAAPRAMLNNRAARRTLILFERFPLQFNIARGAHDPPKTVRENPWPVETGYSAKPAAQQSRS
ncbi:MAG: hypothetical protein QOI34_813 [Verrucomicrobiota bacterium]